MQDVEVAGVVELEGSGEGEGIHPSKNGIKEVAGDIKALIAPSQLHHVTAGAVEAKQSSETVTYCGCQSDSSMHGFVTHPSKLNLEN